MFAPAATLRTPSLVSATSATVQRGRKPHVVIRASATVRAGGCWCWALTCHGCGRRRRRDFCLLRPHAHTPRVHTPRSSPCQQGDTVAGKVKQAAETVKDKVG